MGQEIERKWRVRTLPKDYRLFPCKEMEQAYLCVNPTLRVRKEVFWDAGEKMEEYIFCYKGKGRLSREEYNLPLTKEAFEQLLGKTEGRIIRKKGILFPMGITPLNWMFSKAIWKDSVMRKLSSLQN